MELLIEVITAIRNIRGEMNVPPGEQIDVLLHPKRKEVKEKILKDQPFIQNLAKVKSLKVCDEVEKPAYSAFAVVRDVEIFVPMDRSKIEEEAKRLHKEILKVEKEIVFVNRKLSNEQFLSKAPAEVVEEEKEKALQYQAVRGKLEENLKKLKEALSR
jgi:valyl-tRNA synthetase